MNAPGREARPQRRSAVRFVWRVASASLSWSLVLAAESPLQLRSPAWNPEDILLAEEASDFQFAPDATRVVWVQSRMSEESGERIAHLYLAALAGQPSPVQLTRGEHRNEGPRWSPDGRRIVFRSTRPLPKQEEATAEGQGAKSQLWVLDTAGGEPWPLTRLEREVVGYGWQDATRVVFAAAEDPSLYERMRKERKDDSIVVEDEAHAPPVRLFRVEVTKGDIERLTHNDDWIDRLWVSPDGRWAVTRHQRSLRYEFDQAVPPRTFLTDLRAGTTRELFAGMDLLPEEIVWEPDAAGFYIAAPHTRHPRYKVATISLLYHYALATEALQPVPLGWERGLAMHSALQALEDGVAALLADGVRVRPAVVRRTRSGWRREWIEGRDTAHIFDWAVYRDGRLAVLERSSANRLPEWSLARLAGGALVEERAFFALNAPLAQKPMPRTEVVRFRGARDEEVEGILSYPLGYEEGRRYPLILAIHGGPAAADLDAWSQRWAYPKMLLNQRGAFVLEVNYHGSAHYGLDWVESIGEGRYYELEIPDLLAGVAYTIERGLVDPERLATLGWSNGAILSIELTARDPRFRAASAGAGDVEWISDWGNVDFGAAFDNYYFGASPLEDPQRYLEKSPFFRLDRVVTPTLIFFGTEDRNVPPSQGWSHFRALQQLGKTEVRFVLFPGEPHGLQRLAHQRRKVEEDLAWFERHLFREATPANEALRPGSPLALLLSKRDYPRLGEALGVVHEGIPVPETVRFEGIEVGRFEVTRAQFAAFDPSYAVPPGTGNYPANAIAFEQARAYCRWLSERTGRRFRLPTAAEAAILFKPDSTARENTLDRWAGYPVNPEDFARLRGELARLEAGALLEEVASHPGRGDPPVFDLGGNVAEWIVAADGSPQLAGGSADRPADPKGMPGEAAPAYRGFRVVVEAAVSR